MIKNNKSVSYNTTKDSLVSDSFSSSQPNYISIFVMYFLIYT